MKYVVFFFKQKTAYEMRISDWSSDVCSSDLDVGAVVVVSARSTVCSPSAEVEQAPRQRIRTATSNAAGWLVSGGRGPCRRARRLGPARSRRSPGRARRRPRRAEPRSEAPQSELQALMRSAYTVF